MVAAFRSRSRKLDDYAAIFLANVARPGEQAAAALVRYVEEGGGLFISVGDKVDADVWNQRLKQILPQPLGLKRTAAARPGVQEGETVDTRPAERLAPIDRRHPLLAGFSAAGDGLTSARFFQYLLLQPTTDTGARSVVLRYETGAPALIESQAGRGRVLLLTTTVDREWTDLPIRPGFLPLVQEAARRLAGAPSGDAITSLLVGGAREIAAGPDDRRIEITKPNGELRALVPEVRPSSDRAATDDKATGVRSARSVVFRDTDQIGGYRVRAFRNNGAWVERPDDTFLVNLDGRESDPAVLPANRRPDRAGDHATAGERAPTRRFELGYVLSAALIAFLLVESILTLRVRSDRAYERRGPLTSEPSS